MSNLKAWLKRVSVEDASGSASTGVNVDPALKEDPTVLEDPEFKVKAEGATISVEDDGAAEAEVEAIANDIEDIGDLSTALENYHDLMISSINKNGYIPADVMRAVSIGMSVVDKGKHCPIKVSVEDFEDPTGKFGASVVAVESIKDHLNTVKEAAGQALEKLWAWFQDLINGLLLDTGKLKQRVEDLKDKARKVSNVNNEPFVIKGGQRLSIDGEFVGLSTEPLETMAMVGEFMSKTYPTDLLAMLGKIAEAVKNGNFHDPQGAFDSKIFDFVFNHIKVNVNAVKAIDAGKDVPSSIDSYSAVKRTPTLPGNKAVYFAYNVLSADDDSKLQKGVFSAAINTLSSIYRVSFETVPGLKMGTADIKVKAPSPAETVKLIDGLDNMLDTVNGLKDAQRKFKSSSDRVIKESRTFGKGFTTRFYTPIIVNSLVKPTGNYAGYMVSMIKLYVAVITHALEHHAGKSVAGNATVDGQSTRIAGALGHS